MIEIKNVSKWYGAVPGARRLQHQCRRGDVVVVCGPSGSGKSTLIKTVNGLEPFQQGEILVDGVSVGDRKTDLPKLRARIGMVFQNFELFPHLSVRDNLTLAQIKVLGRSEEEATAEACSTWSASACWRSRTSSPASCPAASSSAWRSPARWRWTRSRCCSTSRPRRSTRK
jgi:ABC-type polar amino acid transport system ATPase subunit